MQIYEKFEVHNILNPKIWTRDNKLLPEVESKILEIVHEFKNNCEVPLNIVDIHLVGSNASYNYTDGSDLDVHIVTNFDTVDISDEILQTVYNLVKTKFNQDYDISIHGVPIELYVENVNSTTLSNGIYSVIEDRWIKFPHPIKSIPQFDLTDKIKKLSDDAEFAINSQKSENIENLINKLYIIRKNSLDTDGEYGEGNQLFKEIRNLGILDKLKKANKETRSKELTLEKYLKEDYQNLSVAKKVLKDSKEEQNQGLQIV